MRAVSELKQDFEISQSLGDIIDVLKMAALIQFRSFQLREKLNEEFMKETKVSFSMLLSKGVKHPYLMDRKTLPSCIVVVTSDEGFLGELNTLLINAGIDQQRSDKDELIVLGERGGRYLEDMNKKFIFFHGITDEGELKQADKLKNHLIYGYRRRFGRIIIVYPKFVSIASQKVTVVELLPYKVEADEVPRAVNPILEELMVEPSVNRVIEALVEVWLGFELANIFRSSKQSEFAARIMHLEGSTIELGHLKQRLSFEYFRQVHSLRDKVIREISASRVLLGKRS